MLPPSCYNCGKAIGEFEEKIEFEKHVKGKPLGEILNELNIKKICCRILITTSINECFINKNDSS